MLIVLAKVGNERMVGQFALGLAISAPVVILARLGLRGVQGTDVRREYAFGSYMALRLAMMALALVVVCGIAVFGGYDWETGLTVVAVCISKIVEAVSDVFYGLFQQRRRLDLMGRSLALRGFLSVPALAIGVIASGSVLWGAVGLVVAWTVLLFAYDRPRGQGLLIDASESAALQWDWQVLARLAVLALPLGLYLMLQSFNANIPRYFVEQHMGLAELGVFAALAYIVAASHHFVDSIGVVAAPRLATRWVNRDRSEFLHLLSRLLLFAVGAGVCAVAATRFLGTEVLTIAYAASYAEHLPVFLLLMVAGAVSYMSSFMNHAITAMRYMRFQMVVMLLATASTALGCMLLIESHGMAGAALAVVVGSVVHLMGSSTVVLVAFRRAAL